MASAISRRSPGASPTERGDCSRKPSDRRAGRFCNELDDRARQLRGPPRCRGARQGAGRDIAHDTSIGMISTRESNCSRMLSGGMKWVGTPMSLRCWKTYSEIRLLSNALPSITSCFFALNAVASSLKCWISVPGSRSFVKDLRLAFIDARRRLIGLYRGLLCPSRCRAPVDSDARPAVRRRDATGAIRARRIHPRKLADRAPSTIASQDFVPCRRTGANQRLRLP